MPASQAELNRAPILRLDTANIGAAPTDGTTPSVRRMSPRTPTAHKTTGLALGLKPPSSGAAVAIAAGFTVSLWILNPVTRAWFSCASAAIPYHQLWVTFDLNASGLYLQVDPASVATPGLIDFHIWEQ